MSASATITINVRDENERCAFSDYASATLDAKLDENAATGTVVVPLLRTSDPDYPRNKSLNGVTYSISAGNTGALFAITTLMDASAAQVAGARMTALRSANFEAISSYALDVTATDAGGLSCVLRVNVAIQDK